MGTRHADKHGEPILRKVTGYDTIVGFKTGTDKIDLSALSSDASHLLIQTSSTNNSIYLETTAGSFNAATDLALNVFTTTARRPARVGLHFLSRRRWLLIRQPPLSGATHETNARPRAIGGKLAAPIL